MIIETSKLIRLTKIHQGNNIFEKYLYVLSFQSLFELLKCNDPTCIDICNSCITRKSGIVNNFNKSSRASTLEMKVRGFIMN